MIDLGKIVACSGPWLLLSLELPCLFVGPRQGKDIVFRFIIEYI
jgi:hypothetical protein